MRYWEQKEKLYKYTEGVRQFFPLASEQLDTMASIIHKFNPEINSFLDLGCGDGFLGFFVYNLFPESKGVFLDISKEMIKKAKIKDVENKSDFIVQDLGEPGWYNSISSIKKFDLIISGYAIHHLENKQKQRLYNDIFEMLNPNGIFLNLEHVSSSSEKLEEIFNEFFLNNMSNYHKHKGEERTIEEIKEIYYDPNHKALNKLESVEKQCKWLREIGFSNVDCFLKIFELALFGGIKN